MSAAADGLQLAVAENAFSAYLLALTRTAAFILVSPPFNARNVPSRVKATVATALALPLSVATVDRAPTLGTAMLGPMLAEALIGVAMGFLVLIAVATIQAVGELLDLVGGFTLSAALDPMLMVQSSVLGRLHQLTAVTVLFASDGHLMVLRGLATTMPVGGADMLALGDLARVLTADLGALLAGALQIAAPVIAAMLIADIALGLLTRAAPAINPFALSFPLKIVFTLSLAGLVITRLPQALNQGVEDAVLAVMDLAK